MKKAYTIYLDSETYEKLKKFSEKKQWSITKSVEFILNKTIKTSKKEVSNE